MLPYLMVVYFPAMMRILLMVVREAHVDLLPTIRSLVSSFQLQCRQSRYEPFIVLVVLLVLTILSFLMFCPYFGLFSDSKSI